MKHVIFEKQNYRIVEHVEDDFDIETLKGDVFNPKHIKEMHGDSKTIEQLREEEIKFEKLVNDVGVYGYVLEKWNPEIGLGWEHVDSCWGFVGRFNEKDARFNHYIVNELKGQIS